MFDHDCRDADYRRDIGIYLHRPATTIRVIGSDGEVIQTIELEEKNLTRDECDPTWVAMREAEQAEAQL